MATVLRIFCFFQINQKHHGATTSDTEQSTDLVRLCDISEFKDFVDNVADNKSSFNAKCLLIDLSISKTTLDVSKLSKLEIILTGRQFNRETLHKSLYKHSISFFCFLTQRC